MPQRSNIPGKDGAGDEGLPEEAHVPIGHSAAVLGLYVRLIAEKALEKDTGARALRAILEEYMLDIMYEIPKDANMGRVTITREYLEHRGGPRIELRMHPERKALVAREETAQGGEEQNG